MLKSCLTCPFVKSAMTNSVKDAQEHLAQEVVENAPSGSIASTMAQVLHGLNQNNLAQEEVAQLPEHAFKWVTDLVPNWADSLQEGSLKRILQDKSEGKFAPLKRKVEALLQEVEAEANPSVKKKMKVACGVCAVNVNTSTDSDQARTYYWTPWHQVGERDNTKRGDPAEFLSLDPKFTVPLVRHLEGVKVERKYWHSKAQDECKARSMKNAYLLPVCASCAINQAQKWAEHRTVEVETLCEQWHQLKSDSRITIRKIVMKLAKTELRLAMEEHANDEVVQGLLEQVADMKSKMVNLEARNHQLHKAVSMKSEIESLQAQNRLLEEANAANETANQQDQTT